MTAWTDFLREYSQKNNISYGKAMRDPKAQETYKRSKGVVQVKRNVAQRGLADLANKAKKTVEKRDQAMRTLKYIAEQAQNTKGIPKELLIRYARLYHMVEYYKTFILNDRDQKKKLPYSLTTSITNLVKVLKEMTSRLGFDKNFDFSFSTLGEEQYATNEEMGFEEDSYKYNPKWKTNAEGIVYDILKDAKELNKDIAKLR